MAYEMKPGQGSAFKNDNKAEDWHPAYKGRVMLPDGTIHWLDINPRKTVKGDVWISVKIGNIVKDSPKPVDAHNKAKANAYIAQQDDDGVIPF